MTINLSGYLMNRKKITGVLLTILIFMPFAAFAGWVDVTGSGEALRNISNTLEPSYVPCVALDSNGYPHIAWFDEINGNMEIFYLKWNGSSWVDADGNGRDSINISNNSNTSKYPKISLDSLDRPHIVWEDGQSNREVYYLKWNGTAWVDADGSGQESVNISNSALDSHHPDFVLDAIGIPHVVWHEGNEEYPPLADIWYQKRQGGQWVNIAGSASGSKIIHSSAHASLWAAIAMSSSGVPFVFWSDGADENREIFMLKGVSGAWVDADGSGTESINISNTPKYSSWPKADVDSAGNPHVVYEDTSPGNQEVYYQYWNGSAWVDVSGSGNALRNISITHHFSAVPNIRLDSYDSPVIVWQDGAIEACEIRCLKRTGASWTDMAGSQYPFINVSRSPLNSEWAFFVLDSMGYPNIAWAEGGLFQAHEINFLRWLPEGTPTVTRTVTPTFTFDAVSSPTPTRTVTQTFTATPTASPTMTVTPYPTAYAGFYNPCWVDADLIGAESRVIAAGEKPSLAFDASGMPHIAWSSYGRIYYLRWNGSTWVDADGTGTESSMISGFSVNCTDAVLKLDGAGMPAVAWLAGHDGWRTAYYLKWNGSSWTDCEGTGIDEISVPVGFGGFGRDLTFALDPAGAPHIAYSDYPENMTHTVRDIFYLYWTGTEWADADGSAHESAMITDNTAASMKPSLAVSGAGMQAIAWQEAKAGGGFEVRYKQFAAGSWNYAGAPEIVSNPFVDDSFRPQLVFDNSGKPAVAFISSISGNSAPSYLSFDGSFWNDASGTGQLYVQLPYTGTASGVSTAFDGSGRPALAWYGNDAIYHLAWNGFSWADADGWDRESMKIFGSGGNNFGVSLAYSPSGAPAVAWHDLNTGLPEISFLRYECGIFTPTVTPSVTVSPTITMTATVSPTQTESATVTVTPTPYPDGYFEVIPNPYNPQNGPLRFLNTKPLDLIQIYTVSGEFVNRVHSTGYITYWSGKNRYNKEISPGIYYYIVLRDEKVFAKGKLFVINK